MTSSILGGLPRLADCDAALLDRVDDLRRACSHAAQPPMSNVSPHLAAALASAADTSDPDRAAERLRDAARYAAALLESRALGRPRPVDNPAVAHAVTDAQRVAAQRADEERSFDEAAARVRAFREALLAQQLDLDGLAEQHAPAGAWPTTGTGIVGLLRAAETAVALLSRAWGPRDGALGSSVAGLSSAVEDARRVLDLADRARAREQYVPMPLGDAGQAGGRSGA